jgi:predicted ATPase/class 3 adenylate cyclase
MHDLPSPSGARPSGTVTFLLTDIEGSTRRWEADPEVTRAAFARQEAIIRDAVEANGGYAYKMSGDALQAAFPTAVQALLAAVDAQLALHKESWPVGVGELKVRMALHTGVTEERAGDYVGPLLNRVARLLSAGHGAQVLLSQVTHELVQDELPPGVRLLDLGEHRLKDLTRPEHVFQLAMPGLPADFPPLKTLDNRPNNLPMQPTPLIGREQELAEVSKMLLADEVRLLTLTGPGGTGKTRLALQLASDLLDSYPDGAWFVQLAALTDAALVATTTAQTLAVRESPGRPVLDALCDFLADKHLLLVLDNFEQVIGAAGMVSELAKAGPHIKIVPTSRTNLNVYGEHEYSVPPLALPDVKQLPPLDKLTHYEAIELFIERARAVKAEFNMSADDAPAVAEICVRLDGLPLAIELAAARVRVLPPQALLARLSDRLKLLTGGAKDLALRQQTLRGTIDWSFNLLSEEEKQLFSRMAVFQGGCTLQAMEVVCNYDGKLQVDVLDGAQSLVDKSLLRQREGSNGETHFWMLGTIEEYAREKLEERGEAATLRREHALYYMSFAEEAEPHLIAKDQQEWLDVLEEEHDNIRAAMYWARESETETETEVRRNDEGQAQRDPPVEIGLRIAGAMGRFWNMRGYYSEGREQIGALLELEKVAMRRVRTEGNLSWSAANSVANETIDEYAANRATALSWAGVVTWNQGDITAARSLQEESLSIRRELGDRWGIAFSLNVLGIVAFERGDYAEARSMYEMSLSIRRELDDKWGIASSLNCLGTIVQEEGDYAAARPLYEESLAICRELGDKWAMTVPLNNLGAINQLHGDYDAARTAYEECLSFSRELKDMPGIAYALAGLGEVAVGCASGVGSTDSAGQDGIETSDAAGEKRATGIAARLSEGARLLGAAEVLLESTGTMMWSEDRRLYETAVARARTQLGEEEFEKAWAEGRAMGMDETIRDALRYSAEPRSDKK